MSESQTASALNVNNDGESTDGLMTGLNQDSSSYSFIEYFLRLSMHASTARILSAWEVSNPQLTLQFEKRSKVTNFLEQIILNICRMC